MFMKDEKEFEFDDDDFDDNPFRQSTPYEGRKNNEIGIIRDVTMEDLNIFDLHDESIKEVEEFDLDELITDDNPFITGEVFDIDGGKLVKAEIDPKTLKFKK